MAGQGIGLAGIPEVDTGLAAQNALVARAQGSLVPDQTRPAATGPVELGQQAGQPATAKPAGRKPGTIDFEKDPLGSIGVILREAGAALQGKPSPSAKTRKEAGVEERQLRALELQEQGNRLKTMAQRLDMTIKGSELVTNMPPNEAQVFIADFQKKFGSPDFDIGELMQQHYDGELEGGLEALKRLKESPIAAAFFAQGNFEGLSPKQLMGRAKSVLKLMDEFAVEAAKRKKFDPLDVAQKKKLAKAGRETPEEAGKRAEKVKAGQLRAEGEGPRELEGARTVDLSENFSLPDGRILLKGTPITVRPVKDKSFSVTSVLVGDKMVEVEIPDILLAKLDRQRKLEVPTATQLGRIEIRQRFLDDALSQLQKLKSIVVATPTGAAGEILGALQGTYDQALTLAETLPGLRPLVDLSKRGIALIDSDLFEAQTPEEETELEKIKSRLLDTNLPAIPIIQEGIAIALAAASFPTTQRIPVEAIKAARKNVDLTGLFGPGRATALVKLDTIIDRIESNKTFLGQRKRDIGQPTIKGKPASSKERMKRLREQFKLPTRP